MRNRGKRGLSQRLSKRMWLLLALLALLPVMAFFQYLWICQVSDAARERARARLEGSVEHLVTEFDAEITRAHMAFWVAPREPEKAVQRLSERYQEWNKLAPYPQLIHDIFLIETSSEPWRLTHIDSSGAVTPAEWSADLASVRVRLEETGRGPQPGFRRMSAPEDLHINGNPAFLAPVREGWPGPGGSPWRGRGRPDSMRGGPMRRDSVPRMASWAVISLDSEYIRREFLPELTKRIFREGGESEYGVLVVRANAPEDIVFQSDPEAARGLFAAPDATVGLFATRPDCFMPAPSMRTGPAMDFRNDILTRKP